MSKPVKTKKVTIATKTRTFQEDAGLLLRADSVNEENRTVEVIWTTGARVLLNGWLPDGSDYGPYYEELDVSTKAIDLGRLNNGAPLLKVHRRRELSDVIGAVINGSADINGSNGTATVKFSQRAEAEEIFADVKDKILQNVSVGYSVQEYHVTRTEGEIPIFRATKWTPKEISIVPVGADDDAGFRADHTEENPCLITGDTAVAKDDIQRKDQEPKVKTDTPAPTIEVERSDQTPSSQTVTQDHEKLRAEIREQERQRADGIREAVKQANLTSSFADELISRDCTIDQARGLVLEELAKKSQETRIRGAAAYTSENSSDNPVVMRERMADAAASRFTGQAPKEEAREYLGLGLHQMASDLLSARGEQVRGLSRSSLIERALTTSDFPALLGSVGNRVLLPAYEQNPSTYQRIAKKVNLQDFRRQSLIRDSDFPELKPLNESGELIAGAMSESEESIKLQTFGRKIKLTRQAIINDDLNSFASLLQKIGQAAARHENKTVWNVIISNQKMADGKPLFHSSHKNLAVTPSVLSAESIGLAKKAIRTQTNESGSILNYTPKLLAIPSALETAAEQYLSRVVLPSKTEEIVPESHKSLELVVEPELDTLSETNWHLFVDPMQLASVVYSYLDGHEAPQVRIDDASLTGVDYEVILDFAAAPVDFRGAYRNVGA